MIYFKDWLILADCEVIARQYDNLSRSLSVFGDMPDGWGWEMLVQAGDNFDILPLTRNDSGASIVLTAEMLSVSGRYTMQLRGTKGEVTRHTNLIDVFIPSSMTGDAHWPTIPSEFTELEKRMQELANTYPTIGDNGHWFIGGDDTGVSAEGLTPYIGDNGNWWIGDTDTGVPASGGGGSGNVYSTDVSTIRVLSRAEYDAMDNHDPKTLYLITG